MSTPQANLSISNFSLPLGAFPVHSERTFFKEALESMNKFHLGIVAIISDDGKLQGVLTDGDIRRILLSIQQPLSALFVDDIINRATTDPISVKATDNLSSAISIMEKHSIWDLPVVNQENQLSGLLHLHPIVKSFLIQ